MFRSLALVPVLAITAAVNGATIYVDAANCPGPGDGSELDPYCSIQTAIDNAVDTDEIVVAPGTYFEEINFIGKAVWLHSSGGAEVTIIDGTGNFHVVQCVSGEGPNTVLDGFTITGGNANGPCCTDNRGGGMFIDFGSPTVTNCTFSGNTAGLEGGGMFNSSTSSPTVTNCTFSGNNATNGGGMYNTFLGSPTVSNCVLWGDSPNEITGEATVQYSNVQGGWPGTGNIDADPLFPAGDSDCCFPSGGAGCDDPVCETLVCDVNPFCCFVWDQNCADHATDLCPDLCPLDFRLSPGSPCIDAGDNAAVPEGVLRDLDGNPRFVADACAGESGATVDMGAYEFQGTSCNLGTMLAMLAAWGSCSDCGNCSADFDGDCSVGILDLLILLGNCR